VYTFIQDIILAVIFLRIILYYIILFYKMSGRKILDHSPMKKIFFIICGSLCLLLLAGNAVTADQYAGLRRAMVKAIEADVFETSFYINKHRLDPRVMDVMGRVERQKFVPDSQKTRAYKNIPLPIGYGQTISQPYIVALMTDLTTIDPGDRVLEIGTGSGYQAAVLAEMGAEVFTIEIVEPLAEKAKERLAKLGYDKVKTRTGDGYYGWTEEAPFDAIVVTAAAGHVPPPLIRQLKPGGVMIIPVGSRFMVQQLVLVTKDDDAVIKTRQILPVSFVPLTGDH
jgi:protein-L-isoaspartate(D-aspartate) O-methyltransferase